MEGGQGGYRDGFACQCRSHSIMPNRVTSLTHLNRFEQCRWSLSSSLSTYEPFCLNDKRFTHIYGFLYVLHYGGRIAKVTVCIDVVIVNFHVSDCSSNSTRLYLWTMSPTQRKSSCPLPHNCLKEGQAVRSKAGGPHRSEYSGKGRSRSSG